MGNSLCGNDQYCFNHIRLGYHAAIDMTREEDESEDDGGYSQFWTMSYNIYESTCTFYLEKFVDELDRVNEVILTLKDDTCFGSGIRIFIRRYQRNYLWIGKRNDKRFIDMSWFKVNKTSNPEEGSVITTEVTRYGWGSKVGLIVLVVSEENTNSNPYKATVAHYYAIHHGPNKIDIGLSMVVNFWVSNNNLNYKVEGPDQHPSSALLYMFEKVFRIGNWKVTTCPHCADAENEDNKKNKKLNPPASNRSVELINNKDINGDGNGNRIQGNQKIKISQKITNYIKRPLKLDVPEFM